MKDEKKTKAQLIEELRSLRKECEAAPQASAGQSPATDVFHKIVENAHDAIISINRSGFIVFANRRAEEMFGYTADEMRGKSSAELTPRESRDAEERIISRYRLNLPGGLLTSLKEGVALHKNGTLLPVEASYYGYQIDGEYFMTGIIRDISGRKRIEEALERARDFSEKLVESSIDPIVITDTKGTIVRINSAFVQLIGLENKEQIIGQSMVAFFPDREGEYESSTGEHILIGPDFFQTLQNTMARRRQGERVLFIESCLLRADKRIVPIEAAVISISDKNEVPIGAVSMIRDRTEKKKAENEITESRDFLKQLFNVGVDGLMVIDAQGQITMVNDRLAAMLGYAKNDLIGKSMTFFTPVQEKESVRNVMEQLRARGIQIGLERTWIRGDGSCIDVEVNVSLTKNAHGTVTGAFASVRDISERKQIERELEKARDFSDSIIESSLDAIVITDATGTITRINNAFLKLLGYEKQDSIIGQPMTVFSPAREGEYETIAGDRIWIGRDFFETTKGCMSKLIRGEKIFLMEGYHIRTDNKIVPVEDTINPLFDEKGAMTGSVGIIRDITDRKKAEKQLSESRDFLALLFDTSLDGILVSDAQGQLIMVNNAAASMLRYSKNELIGKHPTMLTPMQETESAKGLIKELFTAQSLTGVERTWVRGDGSFIDIEMNSTFLYNKKGDIIGGLCSFRDIGLRKKADMALRISEERYRRIFENAFVALQEVDISRFMAFINDLKAHGMQDIRAYLDEHPEFLWQAISMAHIIDINDASLKLYGAKSKEELIASMDTLFSGESTAFREGLIALAEGMNSFQAESVHHTLRGDDINVLLQINFLAKQRDLNRILVSIIDITQVKSAEKKLLEYQQRLRSLTNELSTKEENERRNLGMYLHDRIGQSLSALKIQLEMMASELTGSDDRNNCRHILKQIEATIHDTRALSYELSPVILHELGLEAALGWLTEQTQKQHSITISFKSDKKIKQLDDDVKIILYRSASELLTNIVRHSRAVNAAVAIRQRGGQLQITVEDNGVGFDPAEMEGIAAIERGFGLFSIKERLHYLGGSVAIRSAPRKGTQIKLLVPLKGSS